MGGTRDGYLLSLQLLQLLTFPQELQVLLSPWMAAPQAGQASWAAGIFEVSFLVVGLKVRELVTVFNQYSCPAI